MSDETKKLLRALRQRRSNLQGRIDEEDQEIQRWKHKSRAVRKRVSASTGTRRNLYLDKAQELDLIIDFIRGRVERKTFVRYLAGDEADYFLAGLGRVGNW